MKEYVSAITEMIYTEALIAESVHTLLAIIADDIPSGHNLSRKVNDLLPKVAELVERTSAAKTNLSEVLAKHTEVADDNAGDPLPYGLKELLTDDEEPHAADESHIVDDESHIVDDDVVADESHTVDDDAADDDPVDHTPESSDIESTE